MISSPSSADAPLCGSTISQIELALVEVQASLFAAVETPSADLGGSGVVGTASTPSALELGAGSREVCAWLARVDGGVYAAGGEVEAAVAGDFS